MSGHVTFAKPESRVDERARRNAAKAALERDVYRAVDERDKRRCRVCGHSADPRAMDSTKRGEHHHVVLRSAGGETSTGNVCLLCVSCHAARHAYRLCITGDADGALKSWRP